MDEPFHQRTACRSMKVYLRRIGILSGFAAGLLLLGGCSSIAENTRAELGTPIYPRTDPARVLILREEPKQAHEKLGEIVLRAEGDPSRERLEKRLRKAAARLGADAVCVVHDQTQLFPVVYVDGWWGPDGMDTGMVRDVVAVAIKFK
jgi:hypothetical protein